MPTPTDGEVEHFELWDLERLEVETRRGGRLSPRMRAVMADLLVRHGQIGPDTEGAEYPMLLSFLHSPRLHI